MPACAHVAQSVCSQVPYDMHTHTGTNFGEGAQLSAQENKLLAMRAGGMDSTSPTRRVMQNLPARTRLQLRASCATGPAASGLPALWPTCCHCHATPATPHTITLRPALPGSCPSRCAVYTAPPSPNARPARPAAVACDVCAMQCAVTMLVWCALSDTIGSAASC